MAESAESRKIRHLRESELFSSCSAPELEIIAKNSSFLDLKQGSAIFSLGDEGKSLFIVDSGEVVISKPDNENRMIEIARFVRGDCFGELDMLTGLPRSASAAADTDASLLVFPKKGMFFKEMLEKYPEVSARILHKFIMQISGRIRKANSLVKENSPLVQELSRQVYRDKLTGLYNKIWLEENLKEILLKQTDKDNLSLIMLKPDNFKAINDAHGHEAGDHALRIISRELSSFIPEEAVLVRYMGNELAVVLPGFGREAALNMAENIMTFMHEMDLSEAAGGSPFLLSVSFGIAHWPEHASDSEELIQCAHELPLIGRGRGGNIILFPEDRDSNGQCSMNTSLEILRKIDMLSSLDNEEIEQIYSRMKTVVKKKGEQLFNEGDIGEEMYIVVEGKVAITVNTPDGSRVEIAVITGGNFFGEMSIFENAPRSATCTTKEETTLLEFSKADFFNLMDNSPTTAIKIMHRMLTTATVRLQNTGAFLSDMVTWGEKARRRALTDEFTGFYNRRFLDDALDDKFAQADFNKRPLSLVMVDLDNFGKLNKAYGEAVGDKVLLSAVPVFKSVFRDGDILARYGGDEFTFILPDTGPDEALELCRKAVKDLRKITILENMNGSIKKVTASIGVASYPAHAYTLEKLKDKTDKALYEAKEKGRDTAVLFEEKAVFFNSKKKRIPTIAEKNRIVRNIIKVIEENDKFLLVGHKNPDEDCIASMVAFSLLLAKLSKTACPVLYREVHHKFPYLLNICRYNSICFIESEEAIPEDFDAILVFDTPKPSMLEGGEKTGRMIADSAIIKVELDHHLEADSGYIGDRDYCLVDEASSTCELIGYFALKLSTKKGFLEKFQMPDLFSRNFVLSVMTGMISDSKMGKYLKSNREKWFYNFFSTLFNDLLVRKTNSSTGNFSTMGDIFNELERLSDEEDECYKYFIKNKRKSDHIGYVIIKSSDAEYLYSLYEQELIITVARYTADVLSEDSGYISLVVYYDKSDKSNLIQFRMRRSQEYRKLDLRKVIEKLKIENGGGHPGAVGFRVDRNKIADIEKYTDLIILETEELIKKSLS